MPDNRFGPKMEEGLELELDWKGRAPRQEGMTPAPQPEQRLAGRGAPGEARFMTPEIQSALEPIIKGLSFTVKQIKEWGEILTGWETRNRYEVFDDQGRAILEVGEMGEGLGHLLLRNFWMFRTMTLEFMTYGGTLVMRVRRPFRLFFRRFEVEAWDGRVMGVLQQRFAFFNRRYEFQSPAGAVLATLEGPWLHPWTFHVMRIGAKVATIRKQWSGFLREAYTDADTFGVEISSSLTDARLRQLILAATLAVDLSYFERQGGQSHSVGSSITRGLFE
jgi:uncharacterized protein YxjI